MFYIDKEAVYHNVVQHSRKHFIFVLSYEQTERQRQRQIEYIGYMLTLQRRSATHSKHHG